MSDYFESEIDPLFGVEDDHKKKSSSILTLNFRRSKDGGPMVWNSDNTIGGMINSVGTLVLSGTGLKSLKALLTTEKMPYYNFLGSEDFVVINKDDYKDKPINLVGVPSDLIS